MQDLDWKLSDFNDRGELNPPVGFLLTLVYLSRYLLYLLIVAVSHAMGAAGQIRASAFGLPPAWLLPASAASFLLLFLVLNRERLGRKNWWRAVLKWSRLLLLVISLFQFLFILLTQYEAKLDIDPIRIMDLGLILLCVRYLITDRKLAVYIRECARGVPEAGKSPARRDL